MKRLICLMLVAIMLLSFVSCKKDETPEPPKPEDVKSVSDIYALDNNKMNFSTLYVVKNEGGIVTFVADYYEHREGIPEEPFEPYWGIVRVQLGNVSTYLSGDYSIITFDGAISPTELQMGDEIICHHDYANENISLPPIKYAYNLFYTGNVKIIENYYDPSQVTN